MTDTRMARTQALARRIGELLDRGMAAEVIRAELIRRNMPPTTADELVRRVVQAKERARARPATRAPLPSPSPIFVRPPRSPAQPTLRTRRAAAPVMLGFAALTFFGGFQLLRGDDNGSAALAARLQTEIENTQAEIYRLEADLVSRKAEAQEIQAMRARIGGGPVRFADRNAYRSAVDRYQRRVAAWNASLPHYQQIGQEYRALVDVYNAKADSLAVASKGRPSAAPVAAMEPAS